MLQQQELKTRGLRFLKTLQVVFRMAAMFSADHMAAAGPMQQSFDSVNALVKETRQLTVGFVDNRVMINTILTTDRGLAQLENEFLKRGIGGLSFEPGITLARYKKVVGVIATSPKVIEEMGGAAVLIASNPIEGVKIIPAGKNQARTEDGDTIIESDAESFLRSKQFADEPAFQIPMAGLEMLFSSAGVEQTAGSVQSPEDIFRVVAPTVEAALVTDKGDPQKSYAGLANLLQEVSPSFILNYFPPERQKELADKPPREIAGEFMEETAMRWAARRLQSAPEGSDLMIVEEDVVRVLLRTLQATQMSERLAERLAHYVKEYTLPKSIYDRIQTELQWTGTPTKQKIEKLLAISAFSAADFKRLLGLIKDLIEIGKRDEATELAKHYFGFLDYHPTAAQPEPFSRATDLLRAMAGVRTDFSSFAAERLGQAIFEERYTEFVHYQVSNCLATLSKSVGTFEDFELVQQIGNALEKSMNRDRARHAQCCGAALRNMLAPSAVERILELLIINRDDPTWTRLGTSLLRWSGVQAVEKVFQRLEEESHATTRLALVRFMGYMGEAGIEVARQRLAHERWYVVRNACQVLSELKDPELLERVGPLLRHPDHHVQQAAFNIILKSRLPGRGKPIADALDVLHAHLLDQAIEELIFVKEPMALPQLEAFILERHAKKPIDKAVMAVADTPGQESVDILFRILHDAASAGHIRRAALQGLLRRAEPEILARLEKFAADSPSDPLAASATQGLARVAAKAKSA